MNRYTVLIALLLVSTISGCNSQQDASPKPLAQSPTRNAEAPRTEDGGTTSSNIATSASPSAIIITDRLQREVRFDSSPRRIISLTPATTELLYAIGAGSQIVGATKNCNYPDEAEKLTRVGGGTLQSLSREAIVGLQPDLVLCKWDNHQPLMETLKTFDIPCVAIGAESLEELYKEAVMLGNVTGHEEEAVQLVTRMKERAARLAASVQRIPDSSKRKVFYEVWDDPLMTAGPNSFIGEALEFAGLSNIFYDATTSYPRVSDEVVVARNPDIIISPSTHASKVSIEKLLARQGWSGVKAIQDKQVYIIDGDHISRCGPRLLDAIEEMIRIAYPEQFLSTTKEEAP